MSGIEVKQAGFNTQKATLDPAVGPLESVKRLRESGYDYKSIVAWTRCVETPVFGSVVNMEVELTLVIGRHLGDPSSSSYGRHGALAWYFWNEET